MIKESQNGRRFILINILDWLWKVDDSCGDGAGEARWRSGPAWDTHFPLSWGCQRDEMGPQAVEIHRNYSALCLSFPFLKSGQLPKGLQLLAM